MDYTLLYNPKEGLYYQTYLSTGSEIKAHSHEAKGVSTQKFEIPEDNFSVVISTKFGYGRSSYIKALIQYNGNPLLHLDTEKLYALNDHSLLYFFVSPNDEDKWKQLFDEIIYAYRFRNRYPTKQQIENYLSALDAITEKESVEIKSYWHSDKTIALRDRLAVFSLYSDNLKILLEQTAQYEWFDEEYKEQLRQLCRKFIDILFTEFSDLKLNENPIRTTREGRLVKTFDCIHNYLQAKGDSTSFLSMCLKQEIAHE